MMEYDGFDRLAKLRYPNGTGGGTSTTDYEQYAFDDYGRPYSSRNREGDLTYFTFDALSRLTAVNAPSGTQDTEYTYDNLGRTTSAAIPSVQSITMAYDALGRQTSEYSPTFGTVGYQYDAAGRMTRITWPDAYYAAYEHDLYGAITAIRENGATSGAGVLATYGWTNLGLPSSVSRADNAGASTTYTYDAFGRLTALAHNASGSGDDVTLGFAYNPASQITGRSVSDDDYVWTPATGATTYDLNGLNQTTEIDSTSISYDDNQNLTTGTGHTYAYDAANRLQTATDSATATFLYDANSRLLRSSGVGPTRYFLYAGMQAIAEYDDQGAVTNRYVPGLRLDSIVTSYAGSGTSSRSWLLADERGSVVALANGSGVVSNINRYDEYGMPAAGNAGRFQYTGQAWMAEAGAYHYRARAYLPEVGRFSQTDPIGYSAGTNLYAYVGADPVNWVDPMGLQEEFTRPSEWFCSYGVDPVTGERRTPYYGCRVTERETVTIWNFDFNTSFAGNQELQGGGFSVGHYYFGFSADQRCTARVWGEIFSSNADTLAAAGAMAGVVGLYAQLYPGPGTAAGTAMLAIGGAASTTALAYTVIGSILTTIGGDPRASLESLASFGLGRASGNLVNSNLNPLVDYAQGLLIKSFVENLPEPSTCS